MTSFGILKSETSYDSLPWLKRAEGEVVFCLLSSLIIDIAALSVTKSDELRTFVLHHVHGSIFSSFLFQNYLLFSKREMKKKGIKRRKEKEKKMPQRE